MENKKRLIDANGLFDRLYDNEFSTLCPLDEVCGVVDNCPTVDAVEVVRCKDCKWYMPGELFTDIMFCHRLKKENGKPAKYNFCDDDFCSYGERKEN